MEVLVQVQNIALDPATTDETLRDLLINTLELVEKDQNVIASLKRLQSTNETMITQQRALIDELKASVAILLS